MDVNWDSAEGCRALDPADMLGRLLEFPAQFGPAYEAGRRLALPAGYKHVRQVVVAGMGGSAIAGDYAAALLRDRCRVPIFVWRDYGLPAFAGPETLVVASSYSGNTEETLSALDRARRAGARVVALTGGGELAGRAEAAGYPVFKITYQAPPRAALAYSLFPLLGILAALEIGPDLRAEVAEAGEVAAGLLGSVRPETLEGANPAKALARAAHGRVVVIYGGGSLEPVARRWKTQVNENSKAWAFFEALPELNHNAVVGYAHPPAAREAVLVVGLASPGESAELDARLEVTAELLRREGYEPRLVAARGTSRLARMMHLTVLGDWFSYYLALLNGVDPTPVPPIDFLKAELGPRRQGRPPA